MKSRKGNFMRGSMGLTLAFAMAIVVAPTPSLARTSASSVINKTESDSNYQTQTAATKETAPQENTVSQGADKAKSSQSSAAMMNMMMAAALTAACLAPCPQCQMALCAMGALAAMQGMHDAGASGQSAQTYTAGTDTTAGATATEDTSSAQGEGTSGFKQTALLNKGADALKNAGMKVSAAGVTNADGSFTPASAFSSPSSMAAAGIDPSAIDQAQKILADAGGGGYKVASAAVDGGGGGGASSVVPEVTDNVVVKGGVGLSAADRAKLLAGKTVMFDGTPIGVRGDNIFEMLHVAYNKKRDSKNFIESEVAELRRPASVPKK